MMYTVTYYYYYYPPPPLLEYFEDKLTSRGSPYVLGGPAWQADAVSVEVGRAPAVAQNCVRVLATRTVCSDGAIRVGLGIDRAAHQGDDVGDVDGSGHGGDRAGER